MVDRHLNLSWRIGAGDGELARDHPPLHVEGTLTRDEDEFLQHGRHDHRAEAHGVAQGLEDLTPQLVLEVHDRFGPVGECHPGGVRAQTEAGTQSRAVGNKRAFSSPDRPSAADSTSNPSKTSSSRTIRTIAGKPSQSSSTGATGRSRQATLNARVPRTSRYAASAAWVARARSRYPFEGLIGRRYPLAEINQAFDRIGLARPEPRDLEPLRAA